MPVFAGFIVGLSLVAFSPPPAGIYPRGLPPGGAPCQPFPPSRPSRADPTHWPRAAALDYRERQAAFRLGCESPSRFSRRYRRLFGASPRPDVAAFKGASQRQGIAAGFRSGTCNRDGLRHFGALS
jgi:hypothetical protein